MPSTRNRVLTLTRIGGNVEIKVTYDAVFSTFDRRLAGLGLQFIEAISVVGFDAFETTLEKKFEFLPGFVSQFLLVADGAGELSIPRTRTVTVPRAQLDEDRAGFFPDMLEDEILCRIQIRAFNLPPEITTPFAFTNMVVLGGSKSLNG